MRMHLRMRIVFLQRAKFSQVLMSKKTLSCVVFNLRYLSMGEFRLISASDKTLLLFIVEM